MKNKENASAIVLAILMLAFFMALSLNMYYLTQKKGERAAAKAEGVAVTGQIDGGSSLGYYELFMADQYVSKGYFLDKTHPNVASKNYDNGTYAYTEPTNSDDRYTPLSGVASPQINATLGGIVLNNYNEYFGSLWDSSSTGQAVLISEKIESAKVVSRNWQTEGENIKRLWNYNSGDEMSVGGYEIDVSKNNNIDGTAISPTTKIIDEMKSKNDGSDHDLVLYYTKEIVVPDAGTGIDGGTYRITYEENVNFTVSGSAVTINTDSGNELTVERVN